MEPRVTRITEGNQISTSGNITNVLVVQFMVGTHGPFTVTGTSAELQNGTILQKMRDLAMGINALPQVAQPGM